MTQLDDTVEEVLGDFDGTETYDQAEFALRDYSSKEIAVNAAKLAVAGGGAPGGSGGWPVSDFIVAYQTPKSETNFDNVGDLAVGVDPFGVRYSDNTDGALIEWYTAIGPGTYQLVVKGWTHPAAGILEFSINGTVIDQSPYGASNAVYDTYSSGDDARTEPVVIADDITIADGDVYVLRATVNGKNASSSGFTTNLVWLQLRMVAE